MKATASDRIERGVRIVPRPDRRWSFPGGDDDAESLTLYIVTAAIDGGDRQYEVRLPLNVADDGELIVGAPQATEV